MKRRGISAACARPSSGLTMVELLVATGLFTLLLVGLFALLEDFLRLWDKGEQRRVQVEESSGMAELLAADLAALEPGPRGDLLAEWVFFDVDGDGATETKWPRLRLVRHASDAEIARLQAGGPEAEKESGQGLLEIIWTVLPAREGSKEAARSPEGILVRGERIFGSRADGRPSVFADAFLSSAGRPAAGTVEEVSSGVLWLGLEFATQTSVLSDGWSLSGGLQGCLASWDAWKRARTDTARHVWNECSQGLPDVRGRPLLPRRVRVAIELEREKDWKRRTTLAQPLAAGDGGFQVLDPALLPQAGGHVLIDREWMLLTALSGRLASVRRGQRGTPAHAHEAGALVHHGRTRVREVPIGLNQEDWNL